MSETSATSQQVHLQSLASSCRSLLNAFRNAGLAEEKVKETFVASLAGECVQCGIRLTGEELFTLGAADEKEVDSLARLARLRQGYCARNGCNSYYYRLELKEHPGVDWTKMFSQVESVDAAQREEEDAEAEARRAERRAVFRRLALKAAAGLAVVLALLLIRQWYIGGTIPLIREPERFTVDPNSLGHNPSQ